MWEKRAFLLIIIMLLVVTSCVSEPEVLEITEHEPVTFHHYFSGSLSGGIDGMVERYNQGQDKYILNAVPIDHEAYKINILESFKNHTPADLNSYWAGARTQSVIEYLEPIDDIYEKYELEALFPKPILQSASLYSDHYYLIPLTQHYVTFYYNVEVFESLGLEEPETWEDFLKVCEKLKASGVTPIGLGAKDKWPAQFWFDYLLLRTAGYEYRTRLMAHANKYTDEEVVRVLEMWKGLIENGYFNADATDADWATDIIPRLMAGECGMTLMGTWLSGSITQEGYTEPYGVFSFPIVDPAVAYASLGPIDGIIIGKDALNKEGAKDAIVQFTDVNNQIEMAMGSGAFVPNSKTPEGIYDDVHVKLLKDMKRSDHWAFNYDLATSPAIAEKGLDFFVEFLSFPQAYKILLEELEESISD